MRFCAAATATALSLAACSGGGSDTSNADTLPAENTEVENIEEVDDSGDVEVSDEPVSEESPEPTDAAEPAVETPDTDPPVTEPVAAGGDGTSIEEAAALVGAELTTNVRDVAWSVGFDGLVEGAAANDENSCVTLLGSATLDGGIDAAWNGAFQLFTVGIVVDGEQLSPRRGVCDEGPVRLSDRVHLGEVQITTGTTASFGASFELDGVTAADIEAVVLGDLDDEDGPVFLMPTIVDDQPAASIAAAPTDALETAPVDGVAILTSEFNASYSTTVTGMIEIEVNERAIETRGLGRCIGITAVTTLDSINTEQAFVGFGGPTATAVSNGHAIALSPTLCDTDELTAAGFDLIDDISPLPGTSIDTVSVIFIPDELDADLVIGFGSRDSAQLFTPDSFGATPPLAAPADATVIPATAGPFNAATITWTAPFDTVWTVDGVGVVSTGDHPDDGVECVAVLATVTPDMDEAFPPPFRVFADGEMFGGNGIFCDDDPLTEAGWVRWADFDGVAGAPVNVAVNIAIPEGWTDQLQGLVIGRAEVSGDHLLFDAPLLAVIPPA